MATPFPNLTSSHKRFPLIHPHKGSFLSLPDISPLLPLLTACVEMGSYSVADCLKLTIKLKLALNLWYISCLRPKCWN